ncbi:flagellar assembly peptidoglycan hydrolase FlgJ [Massilia arenae]|uniref:Flagellar assembly peptidoglycan hydrolase FlgJ n=1 Tax=Massilia arenae TaxID=2603288 RepID=A0A5C7FT32_9BURK|nr:flagellar assembly peptidoglycan hydrolase FlgJ [Massilia arenae]TXF97725.1 flagellar assembly peptidoglycan hydrolase FlgJ [Massilia arenae]
MRHADFSIAATAPTAATAATAATASTRPTAGLGGDGSFGRVFNELQGEVTAYIQHGDADGGAASSLSAEGALVRLRARGLIMGEDEQVDGAAASGGAAANTPEQQAFLDSIAPWARQAADRLGVAPELVQAHAALESGWGQRPLRTADGASSHNLFGIKAGASWQGATGDSTTTEYINGAALKTRERFRAYPDAASAFQDYARVLTDNPRYRAALNTGNDAQAFAQGLARGGYATDPGYAAKLARIAGSLQGTGE